MPELPEVETLRCQLAKTVIGEPIERLDFIDEKIKPFLIPTGVKVYAVERWGKYLGMLLTSGAYIVIHLRMTGHLLLCEPTTPAPPHTRFVMMLANKKIVFCDPRRFATLELMPAFFKTALIGNPLEHFDVATAFNAVLTRSLPIKQLLLEQSFVAGIGNIYACEILFAAQVSPFRKACSLTRAEWQGVARCSQEILKAGVECRGTSISDWRDLFGEKGEYQKRLSVYAREGEPCLKCGATVEKKKLNGRGTFFCPRCQR